MRVISILNHKGGVGKTTTAVNLAAGLARLGKKTLAIDLDGQANLSYNFGVEGFQTETIYHALRGELNKLPIRAVKDIDNLYMIPSHLDLGTIDIEIATEIGREFLLKDLINDCPNKFDYIIIDCAPSVGLLTMNALTASTDVIIPVEADGFALMGTMKLINIISRIQNNKRINPDLKVLGLLVTKYDKRKILSKEVLEAIKNQNHLKVLEPLIRTNVSLSEASLNKKSIFDYAPNSTGAEDYFQLSKQIANEED